MPPQTDSVGGGLPGTMPGAPALEVRQLAVGYLGAPVVRDVDLVVQTGEIVALVGLNGAGKTTTLRCIAGDLKPIAGTVLIGGERAPVGMHRRVRRGMAYVADDRSVLMSLSVSQNLRLGRGNPAQAFELFPELARMASRKVGALSGGEQQMLSLARAVASKPTILLVDELSQGLAPTIVRRLLNALLNAASEGTAILLVEQQVRTALSVASRGYVLERGRVVLQGTTARLSGAFDEDGILIMGRRN
jgi:branched-chain amino acid transport system ATP-binding protein